MHKREEEKLNKIVEDNYRMIADHYSETRKKVLWEGLYDIASVVRNNDRVIDVGCGSGKLLQAFDGKKIEYLGIDPSVALLEHAREQNKDYSFEVGDIMNLDGFGNNYDYGFCIAVLQHIPGRKNRIKAIKEVAKKIKKGGMMIVSVWDMYRHKKYKKMVYKNIVLKLLILNRMDIGDIVFDWKNCLGESICKRYYHVFRQKELEKECISAGLVIENICKMDGNIYIVLRK